MHTDGYGKMKATLSGKDETGLNGETVIQANGLVKAFGDVRAVDGVDLEVRRGEIFGLLGPNGAGKTTLISMLTTILTPDTGSASVCGYDIRTEAEQVRRVASLVPQDLALYGGLTAKENLDFFASLYGLRGETKRRRIEEALDVAGLREWAGRRVSTFSGGMKRRLNLAVGLLNRPQVLFLDEPTVGVDPQSRRHIFECVRRLVAKYGMTVVYTTHYMEEAETLCDRVAIYDKGRILDLDRTDALLARHGGRRIEVRPAHEEDVERLGDVLKDTFGAEAVTFAENRWVVRADDPLDSPERAIAAVKRSGVAVESFAVREADLETVFLRLTGKSLRDE